MPTPPRRSAKGPRKAPARTVEVSIERLDEEGLGVGRYQGKEIVVTGAFPGEKVVASFEHEGQRRIFSRLQRVINPSPVRIPTPCPHTGHCEGCPFVQMNYRSQLQVKEERVRRALGAYPSLQSARIHPVWGAPHPLGYRTNAKLAFARERGRVTIGLYRRGTHQVTDIGRCPLHHPLINRIVAVVREEVERQDVYVYNPIRGTGLLRYLTVRVSPALGKAMVTFVTAEKNYREITHLAKWLKKKVPEVVSVQQNVNASEGTVILGRETLRILGSPDLIDQVGEIRLRISPASFFQVNHEQAARIYDQVRRWAALTAADAALDLYCGIGGIALNLAGDAGHVIGIEVVEEAVRNARENARLNGRRNCTFRAGDAAELLHDLSNELPPGATVVLNPPRSGCDPQVLQAVAELAPRALLYVSCNPQTLARDLDLLARLGFRTEEVQPVDMFPQTPHIESLARITPTRRGPSKR